MTPKAREVLQAKPRLAQGRAGIRCKMKILTLSPIAQTVNH